MNQERLKNAEASLTDFLGGKRQLTNKSFIDVGCGSGLFSLSAYRLGAAEVLSIDVDRQSLACAKQLRQEAGSPPNWRIEKGSALDANYLARLGRFDVVYSWGVLHHTGNMYQAITNVCRLVKPGGRLFLAIYNDSGSWLHGRSTFWLGFKRAYNRAPAVGKVIAFQLYRAYLFLGILASGRNPLNYVRNYVSNRGMSWHHDILDWLGGYPYQFASPETIINLVAKEGFGCQKLVSRNGIGCNEYLFIKNHG